MDHNSVFSSAQASRLPCASKHMPLARPAGSMNVDNLPSTLHFMIRLFGWSVKKTLPSLSHVGPSVNLNSPASFSSFAPGAMTEEASFAACATNSTVTASRTSVRAMGFNSILQFGCGLQGDLLLALGAG